MQLSAVAPSRALEAYKGGNSDLDAIMDGTDVLDAMRRSALLDRVNEQGNDAVDQLGAMTEDLEGARGRARRQAREAGDLVSELEERQARDARGIRGCRGGRAELKERLEAERRAAELAARLRRREPPRLPASAANAATRRSTSGTERRPQSPRRPASGAVGRRRRVQCPVPGSSFSDTLGAARSGRPEPPRRRHDGGLRHADLRGRQRIDQPRHERPRWQPDLALRERREHVLLRAPPVATSVAADR